MCLVDKKKGKCCFGKLSLTAATALIGLYLYVAPLVFQLAVGPSAVMKNLVVPLLGPLIVVFPFMLLCCCPRSPCVRKYILCSMVFWQVFGLITQSALLALVILSKETIKEWVCPLMGLF